MTSPAWLPLSGHTGGQVRLIDLGLVLPDPWQHDREQRARERRQAAAREQALLDADPDDDEPGTAGRRSDSGRYQAGLLARDAGRVPAGV